MVIILLDLQVGNCVSAVTRAGSVVRDLTMRKIVSNCIRSTHMAAKKVESCLVHGILIMCK